MYILASVTEIDAPDIGALATEGITEGFSMTGRIFLDLLLNPLVILVILGLVGLKILEVRMKKRRQEKNESSTSKKYSAFNLKTDLEYELNVNFLTARESSFFNALLPVAQKYGLHVFAKSRVADFVNVTADKGADTEKFWRCFNEISKKHIDFLLCDVTFSPVLGFEIDDSTHSRPDRIARDAILDAIYKFIGLKVIHMMTWENGEIERFISESVGAKK